MSNHVLEFRKVSVYDFDGRVRNERSTDSQLLLAHQRVKRKKPAMTRLAILLALVSNPHAIRHAPMRDEPR